MIAIIDYGLGNLRSVQKAFEYIGLEAKITRDKDFIKNADKVILPGVGAFHDAMSLIKRKGLDILIKEEIASGKPFMGICLGMQILMETSYEDGIHKGLGIIPGDVVKFNVDLKIPQIGWNEITPVNDSVYLNNLPDNMVYFVHSYHCITDNQYIDATSEYGHSFVAAIRKDNVFATQFHPEKSGDTGVEILRRFGGVL